jgi:hypothetical protein
VPGVSKLRALQKEGPGLGPGPLAGYRGGAKFARSQRPIGLDTGAAHAARSQRPKNQRLVSNFVPEIAKFCWR